MALMARIGIGQQPGQEPLGVVPDMVLRLEDIRATPEGLWRVIFWASGDDYDAYEDALEIDDAIETYHRLAETSDRRLYRVTIAEDAGRDVLHSIVVEYDVTIVDLTMTARETNLLARFPSREALFALRGACRDRGIDFRLEQLYEEGAAANDGGVESRYGVTEAQREALVAALKAGYFDVPRGTTLEDVAADLGVSTSALSTRLRRGQENLLRNTVANHPVT